MKNEIFRLKDSGVLESLMITDDSILVGSRFKSPEKMISKIEKPFWKGGVRKIPFENLTKVEIEDNSAAITFRYFNAKGKNKKSSVALRDDDFPTRIAEYLLGELDLTVESKQKGKWTIIWPSLFFAVLSFAAGWLFYDSAVAFSLGGEISTSGGRGKTQAMEILILKLSEIITPYGILAIGVGLGIYFLFQAKKKWGKPEFAYIYQKK